MRYLRLLAASAVLSFALVWVWVATMPMAFMDAEYPSWRAKQRMLDRCDAGEAIILGDSRAAADIIPNRLPFRTSNLAIGGGEAIEAVAALTRVLACPTHPRLAIVSLDPGHFTRPDLFWDRSVRFGALSAQDITALRQASRRIGDPSVYHAGRGDGLPFIVRDWLYEIRFPPLYFANLLRAGGLFHWAGNQRRLAAALSARGHYYFGTAPGSDAVALDGHLDSFRPLPILDHYFDKLLAMLDQNGIETLFIAMPTNQATWRQVHPAMRDQFAAYLAGYERRYKHFHVVSEITPHWPDRFFGDRFCHLNPAGAERFSALLAQRLQDAPPRTQNDAQNEWLRDTGPDASANVVPISKRGS